MSWIVFRHHVNAHVSHHKNSYQCHLRITFFDSLALPGPTSSRSIFKTQSSAHTTNFSATQYPFYDQEKKFHCRAHWLALKQSCPKPEMGPKRMRESRRKVGSRKVQVGRNQSRTEQQKEITAFHSSTKQPRSAFLYGYTLVLPILISLLNRIKSSFAVFSDSSRSLFSIAAVHWQSSNAVRVLFSPVSEGTNRPTNQRTSGRLADWCWQL